MTSQATTRETQAYRFASRARSSIYTSHGAVDELVELSGGYAFPRCLPDVSLEAAKAAALYRAEAMQYSDVLGLEVLRELIVKYVRQDGIVCHKDNVMVVNGAKHGLDLACRVFIEPGDKVIVTAPTYMTALSILRTHEAELWAISQDEEGLQADELERRLIAAQKAGVSLPKLLFDVPDFHNPTGITTSLDRRQKLIELAERFGFVIVEDDPYRRIRFEGRSIAPMKSLDESGVVIALGTASKILAPGLRIGWVIACPAIIARMAAQKADGGSSPFNQRIFAELLAGGEVANHIDKVIRALRVHRDVMIEEVREKLPRAKARVPQGGYFLWLELPEDIDSDLAAGLAIKNGVKTYSGRLSYPHSPLRNALRLCYSYEEPERIRQGITALARTIEKIVNGELDDDERVTAATAALNLPSY